MGNKTLERIKKPMVKDPPMSLISMRLPANMIDELKEIAAAKGFSGYQDLIRYYVSQGMREDLAALDGPKSDAIAGVLAASGVPRGIIDKAIAAG